MHFRNAFSTIFGLAVLAAPAVYAAAGYTTPDPSDGLVFVRTPSIIYSSDGTTTFTLDLKATREFNGGTANVTTWQNNAIIKHKTMDVCAFSSTYTLLCPVAAGTTGSVLVPIEAQGVNTTVVIHTEDNNGVLLDLTLWAN